MTEQREWKLTPAARTRIDAQLAAIDENHVTLPKCALCGQHTRKLDEYSLCSKTSEAHQEFRAEARSGAYR